MEGRHTLDWTLWCNVASRRSVSGLSCQSGLSRKKSVKSCSVPPAGLVSTKRSKDSASGTRTWARKNATSEQPCPCAWPNRNWLFDYHFQRTAQDHDCNAKFVSTAQVSATLRKCHHWDTSKVKSALTDRSNCAAIKPFFGLVHRCLVLAEFHRTHNLLCKRVNENRARRKRKVASDLMLQLLPLEVQQTWPPAQSSHFQLGIMKIYENDVTTDYQDFNWFPLCPSRPWNSSHGRISENVSYCTLVWSWGSLRKALGSGQKHMKCSPCQAQWLVCGCCCICQYTCQSAGRNVLQMHPPNDHRVSALMMPILVLPTSHLRLAHSNIGNKHLGIWAGAAVHIQSDRTD